MRTLPPRHFTEHSPPSSGRPEAWKRTERERVSEFPIGFVSYPFAESEDAVDEDDGRRRGVEDDGRGAPAVVALPRGGDVDERRSLGRRPWAAQQEAPRRRGGLRDVGGDGRAEDVEAEEHVHGGADPELHQAQDEPRHRLVSWQRRPTSARASAAAAAACRWSLPPLARGSCYFFYIPLLCRRAKKRNGTGGGGGQRTNERRKEGRTGPDRSRPPDWAAARRVCLFSGREAGRVSPSLWLRCGLVRSRSGSVPRCAAVSVLGSRSRSLVVGADRRGGEGLSLSLCLWPQSYAWLFITGGRGGGC